MTVDPHENPDEANLTPEEWERYLEELSQEDSDAFLGVGDEEDDDEE